MSKTKRGTLFRIAAQSLRSTYQTTSPVPSTRTIRTAFTPIHNPDIVYLPWVRNDPDNLLAAKVNKSIAVRPRDTLWWCVITPVGNSSRKVVRNWLERRVRVAFGEALRWRGFDADGRWLGVKDGSVHPAATEWLTSLAKPLIGGVEANLVGTLRMSVTDQALLAPIEDVRRDTLKILDGLIMRQAEGPAEVLQQSGFKRLPKEAMVRNKKPH